MPIQPEWGILQFRSLYQVMMYIELKRNFGFFNIRDKICDWLKSGDLETYHLIKLWNQVSERDGLRTLIVASSVEYAFEKGTLDEMRAELEDGGAADDFVEEWKSRREDKEGRAGQRHQIYEPSTKPRDEDWKNKRYIVIR